MLHAGRLYLAGGGIQKANSQSTIFETYHFERCGPACPVESQMMLSGAASGGTLTLQIAGQQFDVATPFGQTLEEIADAIAAAVHAGTGGAVSVQAVGAELTFEATQLDALSVNDPGLAAVALPPVGPVVNVPALGALPQALLAALLVAAVALSRRRR